MRRSEALGPRSESLDPEAEHAPRGANAPAPGWCPYSVWVAEEALRLSEAGEPWTKERSLAVAMGGRDALTNRLCCGRGPEAPVKGRSALPSAVRSIGGVGRPSPGQFEEATALPEK